MHSRDASLKIKLRVGMHCKEILVKESRVRRLISFQYSNARTNALCMSYDHRQIVSWLAPISILLQCIPTRNLIFRDASLDCIRRQLYIQRNEDAVPDDWKTLTTILGFPNG